MSRHAIVAMGVATLVLATMACSRASSAPTSPSGGAPISGDALGLPGDGLLKASSPTPQSPINDQVVASSSTSGPTLTASAVSGQYTSLTPQYRFRVFDDVGTVTVDSGLVSAPTWSIPVAMTPNKRFTWRVRAEYQGGAGAWSPSASFVSPDEPPAYNRFIGNWEGCGVFASNKPALVGCVANAVRPTDVVSDFETTKRVAWLLRGEGLGLLLKTSGENTIIWRGYSFAAARVCYPNGHIYKLFGDVGPGGANAPTWDDNDFVDPALYVPAIDPAKP